MLAMITESIAGLDNFALYFVITLVSLMLFKFAYTAITPHNEWALVRQNNQAAAWAFAGALLGYALALGSAAEHSINVVDFAVWAVVAFVAQLLAFVVIRVFLPNVSERIRNDEQAAGIMVAAFSLAIGVLNGACMSY